MTAGLLELGEVMLSASGRRLEAVAGNISNASTPGFKKEIAFDQIVNRAAPAPAPETANASTRPTPTSSAYTDFSQGGLRLTGRPLDLALSGEGHFRLRSGDEIFYARGGQFERAADGRVLNAQGLVLQTADGGDLALNNEGVEILDDGTVLEDGLPVARIGVFSPADPQSMRALGGSLFTSPDENMRETSSALVRQGMLEAANVEMSQEMVQMMSALRHAEAGARLVQAYDSLIGSCISTFGRASR